MKKLIIKALLVVTLMVSNQHFVDGKLFVDYVLNGEEYHGVYVEDMLNDLGGALDADNENLYPIN